MKEYLDKNGITYFWNKIKDKFNALPNNSNIVNGSAEGSIRSVSAAEEDADYTIGMEAVSLAEGQSTTASGHYSHAENHATTASGKNSHAEGDWSKATGENSHAEGYYAEANGKNSHAEGYRTIATGECQHVQGRLNIEDTENKYAHIVGNGTGKYNPLNRSNAHTIDWEGNTWYSGIAKIGGTSYDDPNAKELATKEYADNKFWVGTQAQYDAIQEKNTNTLYCIVEE